MEKYLELIRHACDVLSSRPKSPKFEFANDWTKDDLLKTRTYIAMIKTEDNHIVYKHEEVIPIEEPITMETIKKGNHMLLKIILQHGIQALHGENVPIMQPLEDQEFDVWMEGYRNSDGIGYAEFLGKTKAKSFQKACEKLVKSKYSPIFYDEQSNTYWGCRFFETESAARKSFG